MALSVTVSSTDASHDFYQMTITKTGTDTANIALKGWLQGKSQQQNPDVNDSTDVSGVSVGNNNTVLKCSAHKWFLTPTISVTLNPTVPEVDVDIENAWVYSGKRTYPISRRDCDAVGAFLASAQYPQL